MERDPATQSGRIVGIGNDARSRSSTQVDLLSPAADRRRRRDAGRARDRLQPQRHAGAGRPTGAGARLAGRLIKEFAHNLDGRLSGAPVDAAAGQAADLNGVSLLFGVARDQVEAMASPACGTRRCGMEESRVRVPGRETTGFGLRNDQQRIEIGEPHDRVQGTSSAIALALAVLDAAASSANHQDRRQRAADRRRLRPSAPTSPTAPRSRSTRSTPRAACSARNSNSSSGTTRATRPKPPAVAEKLITRDKTPVMMGAWGSSLTLAVDAEAGRTMRRRWWSRPRRRARSPHQAIPTSSASRRRPRWKPQRSQGLVEKIRHRRKVDFLVINND